MSNFKFLFIILVSFNMLFCNAIAQNIDFQYMNGGREGSSHVEIDEQGFVHKDGVKIFPLGVYVTNVDSNDLERIKAAGFNTILSYSLRSLNDANAFLNLADNYDINVIYSLKDYYKGLKWAPADIESSDYVGKYLQEIGKHKSLLAWYVNDELPLKRLPEIKSMSDKVNSLDGKHPVLQVLYDRSTVQMYINTSDIIALDAYPVGRKDDLLLSSLATEKVVSIAGKNKSPWLVPQMMDWGNYKKEMQQHPPNWQELQNQAYQGLIAGAKGMVFYSYYDLFYNSYPRNKKDLESFRTKWREVVAMMDNVKPLIPVILNGSVIDKERPTAESDVKYRFYKYSGRRYLLLANPYYRESVIRFKSVGDGFSFSNVSSDIKLVKSPGFVSLILPPIYSGYIIN